MAWTPAIPGAKAAIDLDGTIVDPTDEDEEWVIELALPLPPAPVLGRSCTLRHAEGRHRALRPVALARGAHARAVSFGGAYEGRRSVNPWVQRAPEQTSSTA